MFFLMGGLLLGCGGMAAQDVVLSPDLRVFHSPTQRRWAQNTMSRLEARLIAPAQAELEQELEALKTPADVRRYQEGIRTRLAEFFGRWPQRTPLNPRFLGKLEHDRYTLEKILIESEPDYYVPINFYLPKGKPLPAPGVCITMGHATEGKGYHLYHEFALGLVLKGYVVCAFDPMGQGERIEYWDPPEGIGPRGGPVGQHHYLMRPSYLVGRTLSGLRAWDGVRVVDYMLTRPEIDPERIAVGGNSGGGQMTLLITACHPQVTCCAAAHPGGSQENTYLLGQRLMDLRIISLIPPRPCRWIVGDTSGEEQGHRSRYDHLQRFYDLLGCPEAQDFVLVEGGHDMKRPKREAAYEWYNRWLQMPQAGSEEDELEPLTAEELWVTPTGQVLRSLEGETGQTINARLMREMAPERPEPAKDPGERRRFTSQRRQRVLRRLGLEIEPERHPPGAQSVGRCPHPRLTIEKLLIESEPEIDLPALLITSQEIRARGPIFLHAAELGKPQRLDEASLPFQLALAGHRVLSVDVRGRGELDIEEGKRGPVSEYDPIQWRRDSVAIRLAGAGRTVLGQRAFDLIRCLDYLQTREDTADTPVVLVGEGLGGSWCLVAAVADARPVAVATVETLASYRLVIDHPWNNLREYFWVPGALADYDLSDLPALIAPRPVALINTVDQMARVMEATAIRREYAWSAKYYEAVGAAKNLRIVSPATPAEAVEVIDRLR